METLRTAYALYGLRLALLIALHRAVASAARRLEGWRRDLSRYIVDEIEGQHRDAAAPDAGNGSARLAARRGRRE